MLDSQLINGVLIDWDKIDRDSYLRNIDAINSISQISFTHSVTFFVGENGSGKSTLLEAIAIAYGFNPEGGTRNYNFSTYDSHSELCGAIRLSRGVRRAGYGYFLRAESFLTSPRRKENTAENRAAGRSISMRNLTVRVFWQWHRTASAQTAYICWMNRRLRLFCNALKKVSIRAGMRRI